MVAPRAVRMQMLALAGIVLIVLGVICWGGHRLAEGRGHHAYDVGAVAPLTVTLTANKTYKISYPGGLPAIVRLRRSSGTVACTYSTPGTADLIALATSPEPTGKATEVFATFIAPHSGRFHIACQGLAQVFVDDADSATFDLAGLLLLLATIALTLGVTLALSAVRLAYRQRPPRLPRQFAGPPREYDQVE